MWTGFAEALTAPGDSVWRGLRPQLSKVNPMGEIIDPLASLRDYMKAEKAPNTRHSYAVGFADFEKWCAATGVCALPADPLDVAKYLASLADRGVKASTINQRCAAIRYAHKMKGLEPPTNAEGVRALVRGIRRVIGTRSNRKAPATATAITAMIAEIPDTLIGKRDRALLLLGFAAALRRSELVALCVDDVERSPEGMRVLIRRSKTDQAGEGYTISVPRGAKLLVVEALEAWLVAGAIRTGPLFRPIGKGGRVNTVALTDHAVAAIVKRYAGAAGLDPTMFSGHSLRTGFVTSALEHGADVLKVMDVTRHRDIKTLKVYDRRARGFKNHAGKDFL
jgi:site-specific recombinase XerD